MRSQGVTVTPWLLAVVLLTHNVGSDDAGRGISYPSSSFCMTVRRNKIRCS
jgi:hypothetical protein